MDFSFLIVLFIVALLYSSVGHGGASGYLALMAVWGIAPASMKPAALILNVLVSIIAFAQFYRNEKPDWQLFLLLIAGSIPAAFIGATVPLSDVFYKKILGAILIFQSVRLWGVLLPMRESTQIGKPVKFIVVTIGAVIGMVSGMIGIGGGILLSPLMVAFRWTTLRQTALISAGFIFLNSLSGLFALPLSIQMFSNEFQIWLLVAFAGGMIGSALGSMKFDASAMKKVLGLVIFIAGLKLVLS